MLNDLIEETRKESINVINQSVKRIKKLCSKDPDIEKITEICLNKEHVLHREMTTFIYECGSSLYRPSSNFFTELKSFLINFFYDDGDVYFIKNKNGFWRISFDKLFTESSANPKDFIEKSIDNSKLFTEKIEKIRRKLGEINR